MVRVRVILLIGTCLLSTMLREASSQDSAPIEATAPRIDYVRDIRPILSDHCYACHGPDEASRQAELRLDQAEGLFTSIEGKNAIIARSDPERSELMQRITSADPDAVMPPSDHNKQLSDSQVELLRRWISEGADWQKHWAFVAPQKPDLPAGESVSAIDRFVQAKLREQNVDPAPRAEKEILLRRVTFDLTGLPPTLEEVDGYLSDESPDAYEKVVDRLLSSQHYGEHMTKFWLDAARYGDTHGLHLDNYREMWPYRDWVIKAFNDNMPFDQFVTEQLAGDLLPDATLEQQVATGFCRAHVSTNEGG